jgi:hypothetical protein
MTDARTTIYGNRLGLRETGELIVDGKLVGAGGSPSAGTSAATFSDEGVTTFGTTLAGAYVLKAPGRAGILKWLVKTVGSSLSETVTASLCTFYDQYSATTVNSSLVNTLTFTGSTIFNVGQAIQLLSTSTTKWAIISRNTSLVTATSA